ncbi:MULTISPECIES: UvrD-helicase domain-containing protein [Myroides]|uniref:DNA 3'-5' helicase n=1 Tax=Myroides albus TaxID=2562892 RepID=A0A6I3LMY4_9FLAO|nr:MULTISPECIES: UvrD-helicase domain-containing protein [Myroides]MTG97542.1 AAA family ATPase [Myroides albus]MVX35066.1 AAA family ATPase [Myroides sp. LoEW2-1]UVD81181.1 UvrD-helicase domain-containing protein [Myroides albus]
MSVNHSFSIYNASAGAGKTHTLVKEYLKILLRDSQVDAYKKILAITFTNKAVAEMKNRVVSCLNAFSKEDIPLKYKGMFDQIIEETGLTEDFVRSRSSRLIKSIIHNFAAFDISTIDRFTHKVIRSFAFDLGLPVTFEVSLESDELLQESVDAVIAKAGTDRELTDLLIDFSLDKADNDKSWDVTRELKEVGSLLLNENNRDEIRLFEKNTIEDFVKVRDYLRQEIKHVEARTKEIGQELQSIIEQKGIDVKSFSRGTFPNHIACIAKDEVKATQKRYFEFDDIAINKTAKDKELIEALIPDFLRHLDEVYKLYNRRAFCQAFLKNLTPLSLLNTLSIEMDNIQSEKNILSISQFNAIIHEEIQGQPAPFIYERLGERYTHFFIDEFQDTSEMQWKNLVPLIDNALAGEDHAGVKGSLMIVGDPKQSIYRWRGGKAEQFIALSKDVNPFSNPSKATIHLDTNYRSYEEVITFNNHFFKYVSQYFTDVDYKDLYENKSYQHPNKKKGGYVEVSFLAKEAVTEEEETVEKNEQFAKATLEAIHKVLEQGFELKDIVILTRKRDHGVVLANYLTENDIEILSSDSLLINNASEVRLIINVLKYLRNFKDIESKTLLLYYIASRDQLGENKHDFITEGLGVESEDHFELWLKDHQVPISFQSCRAKSLYDAVEEIVYAFMPDKSANSYVLYFLDLVLEKSLKNQFGISDFLDYWESNYHKFSIPTPEGKNAVQIMTIHKSKGLEFPVVIFPFAEEDYSRPGRDKLWVDIESGLEGDVNFPKALVDSKKEVVEYGEKAQKLYEQKEQEMLLDNINVLYVALTRAEEQLYVISYKHVNSKGEFKNNLSKFFLDFLVQEGMYNDAQLVYSFGECKRVSQHEPNEVDQLNRLIQPVKQVINFDNTIKIAQREALMWNSHNQKAIEYGNVVHEIMSFVGNVTEIDKAIQTALEQGLIFDSQKDDFKRIVSLIVNHEELKDFFAIENQVFNERAIISNLRRNIIPDRVVIRENKAMVLDYKTGKEVEKYKQQVLQYATALSEIGYEVVKKVLLYTGDDLNIIHL